MPTTAPEGELPIVLVAAVALVDADGRLRIDEFRRILHQRDNRPLFLRE